MRLGTIDKMIGPGDTNRKYRAESIAVSAASIFHPRQAACVKPVFDSTSNAITIMNPF